MWHRLRGAWGSHWGRGRGERGSWRRGERGRVGVVRESRGLKYCICMHFFSLPRSVPPYYSYLEIPPPSDVLHLNKPPHFSPSATHLPDLPHVPHHIDKVRGRYQRSQQRPDEERYQPYHDDSPQRESLRPHPRPFNLLRGQSSPDGRVTCHPFFPCRRCGLL